MNRIFTVTFETPDGVQDFMSSRDVLLALHTALEKIPEVQSGKLKYLAEERDNLRFPGDL